MTRDAKGHFEKSRDYNVRNWNETTRRDEATRWWEEERMVGVDAFPQELIYGVCGSRRGEGEGNVQEDLMKSK